jgi:hypothetical protein
MEIINSYDNINYNEKIKNLMDNIGIDCNDCNCCLDVCENNQSQLCVPINNDLPSSTNFIIPIQTLTGKNKPNTYREVAQTDIVLENQCVYGYFCPHKSNPLLCPFNHHELSSKIIKKGEFIPDLLCRYERPWKLNHGRQMCCMNPQCWYNHGAGRAERIMNNYYHKY